ncbi:MAG TPA: rhodanese-like domain-containing protein [Trueperaceae bacterium]
MFFKRIYEQELAQASYVIGCQQAGRAVVVDPRRDIGAYLEVAAANGLEIAAVTETHVHADYLSGARELAAATGAALYLSDEGGEDWRYRFEHEPLHDGDEIAVGQVRLRAQHTPGHTPEHLSFMVIDGATADAPGIALTGDFVFVGDVGRPDLLDETTGGESSREPMARQLYRSLRQVFLALPDYVQVWPGHGAGSACGKALGAVASSTVGYERRFAWWAGYLQQGDEDGFVAELLSGQPDAPSYFGRMKRQNRAGPALLGALPPLERFGMPALERLIEQGARLLDTRPKEAYLQGAVPSSLHVPAGRSFGAWAAWVLDPESDPRPLVLLARSAQQAEALRDGLSRIGVDEVIGYATSTEGLPRERVATIRASELGQLPEPFILDVRSESEYRDGHIPGAVRIHGGRVMRQLDALPQDRTILLHCQSGARSAVVGSALKAAGWDKVLELEGGYGAYRAHAGAA